jgi:osmoprotectant transport system ATP-binding protein
MIELDHVTKRFADGTTAVHDVSFTVEQGELCVLLGPSGCGKTTTMKMINRLVSLTQGKILIDGKDVQSFQDTELRKQIGYAIQEIGLFPHMTVAENIEVVPELRGWSKAKRRERAAQLLEMVKLTPSEFMDRYPKELSGGQRQRVGVARSLGADPEYLLMDEPFGAIDPITRVDLQNEFLKIQQDIKKTIVFVTHDIYEAIKMGDKVALMNRGELIQYDTPFNILFNPQDKFVADFVGRDRALKGLQLIRGKEVMRKSVFTASEKETVEDLKSRVGPEHAKEDIPVVKEGGVFLGFVKLQEVESGPVSEHIMHKRAVASLDTVLDEALSVMLSGERNMLAMLDNEHRLQGVLAFSDIQRALSEADQSRGSL